MSGIPYISGKPNSLGISDLRVHNQDLHREIISEIPKIPKIPGRMYPEKSHQLSQHSYSTGTRRRPYFFSILDLSPPDIEKNLPVGPW